MTGDSAKILKTKLIDILVHDPDDGVMLLNVYDCTERIEVRATLVFWAAETERAPPHPARTPPP